MTEELRAAVTAALADDGPALERLGAVAAVSHGSGAMGATTGRLRFADGRQGFVKRYRDGAAWTAAERVRGEAEGNRALRTACILSGGIVAVPEVLLASPAHGILVSELVHSAPLPDLEERLARGLAALHDVDQDGIGYGFDCDTFLGDTRQAGLGPSRPVEIGPGAWVEFHWHHRIEPLLRALEGAGASDLARSVFALEGRIRRRLETAEAPVSLLHGDLWSGNLMSAATGPVLVDSAAWFGHREFDLGMLVLFGGLSDRFLEEYVRSSGLEPGWRERVEIHRLHHLLNHRLLFGGSYDAPCRRILTRL